MTERKPIYLGDGKRQHDACRECKRPFMGTPNQKVCWSKACRRKVAERRNEQKRRARRGGRVGGNQR